MKMTEAQEIIAKGVKKGFLVHFEKKVSQNLHSDFFPDVQGGEDPIATEEEAWTVAKKFAQATDQAYVNIYVINCEDKKPVSNRRLKTK